MAEIKRTFSASKMNKDMDERLVPPAEYRDALNVEINTSEGSNVGTVQTVLGNTALTSIFPPGSTCVGSIADPKTDKIYWFVAGAAKTTTSESIDLTIKKDLIYELGKFMNVVCPNDENYNENYFKDIIRDTIGYEKTQVDPNEVDKEAIYEEIKTGNDFIENTKSLKNNSIAGNFETVRFDKHKTRRVN